jgi:hypothetical protein
MPDDLDDLFDRLAGSKFRSRFKLGAPDRDYLARTGMDQILSHARDFIGRRLAPALPPNDGKQTPMRGHPVLVAQHATATCCRSCLAKWHGIASGRQLDEHQQRYIARVIEHWPRQQSAGAGGPSRRPPASSPAQPDLFGG